MTPINTVGICVTKVLHFTTLVESSFSRIREEMLGFLIVSDFSVHVGIYEFCDVVSNGFWFNRTCLHDSTRHLKIIIKEKFQKLIKYRNKLDKKSKKNVQRQ